MTRMSRRAQQVSDILTSEAAYCRADQARREAAQAAQIAPVAQTKAA